VPLECAGPDRRDEVGAIRDRNDGQQSGGAASTVGGHPVGPSARRAWGHEEMGFHARQRPRERGGQPPDDLIECHTVRVRSGS
jgi:hypothetical protein